MTEEETTTTTEESTRPEWLPEKFKTPEDLVKSYQALESKLGAKQPEEEPSLNFENYFNEYSEKGSLSEESRAKLNKYGVSENLISNYIKGQKAIVSNIENEIKSTIGGDENYSKMLEWADKNVSEEEKSTFNKLVNTNDTAQAKFAVQGMYQRFSSATKTEPQTNNLLLGKSSSTVKSTNNSYQSMKQMSADMSKAEYSRDPAFRKSVMDKIANSDLF